ncbi:hypothetical protein [Thermoanaerobaculum aquaticum]|nr:hypothetical protein [Thermoanaerobaculum aquaticum]
MVAISAVLSLQAVGTLHANAPQQTNEVKVTETRERERVSWQLSRGFERVVLKVFGSSGLVLEREFTAGSSLTYDLRDAQDKILADGEYHYELWVYPKVDADVRRALTRAQQSQDQAGVEAVEKDRPRPIPFVQTGSFAVEAGRLQIPAASEGEGRPAVPGAQTQDIQVHALAFNATDWYVNNSIGVGSDVAAEVQDLTVIKSWPDVFIKGTASCVDYVECPGLWFGHSASASEGLGIYSTQPATGQFDLRFINAGVDRMTIAANGKVGVATTAPYENLTVLGTVGFKDGTTPMLRLGESCCASNSRMVLSHSSSFPDWGIFYDDGNDKIYFQQNAVMRFFTADFNSLRLGINTTSPVADLHIAPKDTTASPQLAMSSLAANAGRYPNIRFFDGTTPKGQLISDISTGRFVFDYNGPGGGNFAVRRVLDNDTQIVIFGDPSGNIAFGGTTVQSGARVTVNGNLHVNGSITKTGAGEIVVMQNGDREIQYSVSVGPEIGTYVRGTAELVNGEAIIELPEHFAQSTEAEGLTVHLTPIGGWHRLFVSEQSNHRVVVRDEDGCSGVQFNYLVQGIRKGYKDFSVVRDSHSEN